MTRRTSRRPLVVLPVCVFFVIWTEMSPVGLLPEITAGLGVSTAATGVLVSVYAVVVAVTSVPLAAIVERWPRRLVLTVLLAAYALSNLVFAVAPDYEVGARRARAVAGRQAWPGPERAGRVSRGSVPSGPRRRRRRPGRPR